MADISKEDLRKEITAILKDADLSTTSAKKVRQQLEEKLDCDLSERKKEIDDLVMECLEEQQEKDGKGDSRDEDDEEEDEEEEEEEEEEEKKKPPPKKQAPKRPAKKGSSDESEEGSEDQESDEEYSPGPKKTRGTPKKGAPGKKKKRGSDSEDDSDEDWAKTARRSAGNSAKKGGGTAKRGGGGGKGGGYTRAVALSPELSAIVGAELMPRHEVVKKIWAIIKERNLYDPKNKQFAICDDELLTVFGVKRFRTFGMMKYLKAHFLK